MLIVTASRERVSYLVSVPCGPESRVLQNCALHSPFKPRCGDFVHPSVTKSKDGQVKVQQGVRVRDVPALFCVPEFMFPDTASFQADITNCKESEMNAQMETHLQLVLTLRLRHIRSLC